MTDSHAAMIDQDHLREMIEVISGELELRPLLTIIVQKACELLHADRGSIGLVVPDEGIVRIEAVYRMPKEELGSISQPDEGLAGSVYARCEPVLLETYGSLKTPKLRGMDEDSVIGMPIMWRGDIIGTFGIGAAPPKRFGDNDIRMLGIFARHAAIAIHNARSYQREKHYAGMKERQRLARDLHDNVSQLIFSLSLVAQSIGAGYERSKEEGDARTSRLLDIASLAQREMKALLFELRGPPDDDNSLAAYARANGLAKALARHCGLTANEYATVSIDVDDNRLDQDQTEALLRIAQESVANAIRHGKADNIFISLEYQENDLTFRVLDDGRGMAAGRPEESASTQIGLASMRARAARLGGELHVANRTPRGLGVEVRLPLA
ncbi:GAF domain-containing sensor histidine kinase [Hyphococcus sp.]|uniref:GAF domain-containing sensor histidine kinase n=1 Tax=Hyphococcus sp. TaxID=2038636 RepID=UPI0035C66BBE